MKKLILGLAVATVVMSCQKVADGGNLGRLKLEEGTERYSDDEQEADGHAAADHAAPAHETAKTDSTAAKPADSTKALH